MLKYLKNIFLFIVMLVLTNTALANEQKVHLLIEQTLGNSIDIKNVSILSGGLTNLTYKVQWQKLSLVVRIGRLNPEELFIDRELELQFIRYANFLGIAPNILYAAPKQGVMISEFINGDVLTSRDIKKPLIMKKVVEQIKQYQKFQQPFEDKHALFHRIQHLIQQLKSQQFEIPEAYIKAYNWSENLESKRVKSKFSVATHYDLFSGNMLLSGKKIKFIDWEYAGWGEPYIDIALIAVIDNLNMKEQRKLFELYKPNARNEEFEDFSNLCLQARVYVAIWSLFQSYCVEPELCETYINLANERIENFWKLVQEEV